MEQRWASKNRQKELNHHSKVFTAAERLPNEVAHYMLIKSDNITKSSFGFIASPDLTIWENTKKQLGARNSVEYFNKVNKLTYHNPCLKVKSPSGLNSLVGLGLKFYLKSIHPMANNIYLAFKRMQRDVRLKYFFADEIKTEFKHSLYIK